MTYPNLRKLLFLRIQIDDEFSPHLGVEKTVTGILSTLTRLFIMRSRSFRRGHDHEFQTPSLVPLALALHDKNQFQTQIGEAETSKKE